MRNATEKSYKQRQVSDRAEHLHSLLLEKGVQVHIPGRRLRHTWTTRSGRYKWEVTHGQ